MKIKYFKFKNYFYNFTLTTIDCGSNNFNSFSKRSTNPGIRDIPP